MKASVEVNSCGEGNGSTRSVQEEFFFVLLRLWCPGVTSEIDFFVSYKKMFSESMSGRLHSVITVLMLLAVSEPGSFASSTCTFNINTLDHT